LESNTEVLWFHAIARVLLPQNLLAAVDSLLSGGRWWLTPIILTAQEPEIRRMEVQSQLGQIVPETLS
jgi:hypothetical protein